MKKIPNPNQSPKDGASYEGESPSGSFKTTLNPFVPINDPDNVLQAVLLADSFNERFMPITRDNPRIFLPLVNVPLIEYTFEFLAVAGVQEIVVFCCAHNEKIQNYLNESKWSQPFSPIKIHTVVSPDSMGVGDAMREIDRMSLITNDFILLSGDIVANLNLIDILEEHRARRKKDKDIIMTSIFKEASPQHRLRKIGPESVMVVDKETSELLKYDYQKKEKYVSIDKEVLKRHPVIEYRNDLLDCEIDICSPDVLALFTENFDYQHMRKHFVHGILESDILGKKILVKTISNQYAARVGSFPAYDIISKDVMKRWTFPLVPDSNFFGDSNYRHLRHHIYKESDVVLARSCVLSENVVVGKGSKIGDNTIIQDSVIGEGCTIGSGVTIKDSYIWKDVTIEDNVSITQSVLADNVIIKKNVTLQRGCVISYGVIIGSDITLKEFSKISLHDQSNETDDEELEGFKKPYNEEIVGKEGKGYLWTENQDNEDEDEDEDFENQGIQLNIGEEQEEVREISTDSSGDEEEIEGNTDLEKFQREAVETARRGLDENHPIDNTAIEISALKFAYNTSFRDCYEAVLKAVFEKIDSKNFVPSLKEVLRLGCPLLKKFFQSPTDQLEAILIIQDFCQENEVLAKYFSLVLQLLYDKDILEEAMIFEWYNSELASPELKVKVQKFIKWLEEAEEEDDEDDD